MSPVGSIDLDEQTHALVRFAARMFDVSEADVVARAVRALTTESTESARPPRDPWTPLDVYGEYGDTRVEGQYLPATRRLTVTSEPIAGAKFKSPSGAARAVVAALNPDRSAAQTNGWRFWHIADTDERLEVLR